MVPVPVDARSSHNVIALATAPWTSKALLAAIEWGVFTELSRREGTVADLCGRMDIEDGNVPEFLDILVALGLLDRTDGVYRNAAPADAYLNPHEHGADITPYLSFLNAGRDGWSRLTDGRAAGGARSAGASSSAAFGEAIAAFERFTGLPGSPEDMDAGGKH